MSQRARDKWRLVEHEYYRDAVEDDKHMHRISGKEICGTWNRF